MTLSFSCVNIYHWRSYYYEAFCFDVYYKYDDLISKDGQTRLREIGTAERKSLSHVGAKMSQTVKVNWRLAFGIQIMTTWTIFALLI